MTTLLQDLRLGARKSLRNPGIAAISILTLALGIGLTTMMFSIVDGAILRGLPFEEPDRLVGINRNRPDRDQQNIGVSPHDLRDWREQQSVFEGIAGFYTGTVNISGRERAERYDGAFISPQAFSLLRVRPALGRALQPGDERLGAAPVVVLGHGVWKNRYASDPAILGRTVRVNGLEATVVGVMPESFAFPMTQEVWLPLRDSTALTPRGSERLPLRAFGRLKPGVSVDEANVQMSALARRLAAEYPETNEGVGAVVRPYVEEAIGPEARGLLFTMLGAVFLVLLIACANVANLLLGQAAARTREVGVRSALGAGRGRIVRQFLAEPLSLAAVGAVLGVGIAQVGITLFNRAIADTNPPFWIRIGIDGRVLLFVLGLTLLATFAAGILPALRASSTNIQEVLKDESRGASSLRGGKLSRALVVMEIALSCGLLVGAGLTIKSIVKLRSIDFGFATEDVFTARVGLPESEYADRASRVRFYEELHARLAATPGVRRVALTNSLPGLGSPGTAVEIEGGSYAAERDYPRTHSVVATPGLFSTLDVAVVQGRDFGPQDREGALPVAVVNHSFASRHLTGSPIGQRIRLRHFDGRENPEEQWLTVVGVVPDMFADGVQNREPEAVYTPLAQRGERFLSVVARGPADPMRLTATTREVVASIDQDIPLYFAERLADSIAQSNWHYSVFGSLFMVLGFVALFLAAIGLYGVMAFSVSRRTREMGVRMALGAQAGDVVGLVLRQGMVQLAAGLVLGLALAAGVSRLLTTILFDVQPRDPMIFGSIVVVLAATGLFASWMPALRATRVNPVDALRAE